MQADLVDVSNIAVANGGVRFLLSAVDVVSRRGFVEPLPNQSGEAVLHKLAIILCKS